MYPQMYGHLQVEGQVLATAGFMSPALAMGTPFANPLALLRGEGLLQRADDGAPVVLDAATLGMLARGEITDLSQMGRIIGDLVTAQQTALQRGITSGMTAFPVRENLEAPARLLVPTDTPIRNLLPRRPGAGTASAWKQITSLGGGWGSSYDQPGGGASASQMFFAEDGGPEKVTPVFANKSAAYKLLGCYGDITQFAMAAGANYQDQYAEAKRLALLNMMLNEENALINGDAASTAKPWGDGSTALAFSGLVNLITVANGVPTAQVQTSVGALTTAHIDAQLTRIWKQGGRRMYMLLNAQEQQSLTNLIQASGTLHRVVITQGDQSNGVMGFRVTGYVHPISGEIVDVFTSRFLPAGTMLFGSRELADGSPAADVEVLPQVQLPALAPNEMFQGYVAQEVAPAVTAPQVHSYLVSVFEVLRLKGAVVFAKSTGVTSA